MLLLRPPDPLLLVLGHHPWALPAAGEAEWDLGGGDLRPGLHCPGSPANLPSYRWEESNSF